MKIVLGHVACRQFLHLRGKSRYRYALRARMGEIDARQVIARALDQLEMHGRVDDVARDWNVAHEQHFRVGDLRGERTRRVVVLDDDGYQIYKGEKREQVANVKAGDKDTTALHMENFAKAG